MKKKKMNNTKWMLPRSFASLWMTITMAFAFASCSEEQDLLVPEQTNALHITSVTIDGQDVARTRVVADGGTFDGIPFNQSFNGFSEGDKLQLVTNGLSGYYSSGSAYNSNTFYAIYNADGTWTLTDNKDTPTIEPLTLKPTEGKTWAEANISAAFGGEQIKGDTYSIVAPDMGIVQGDIPEESSIIYSDWLTASTGNGVTIDTDVKSPTLGATTIQLKHVHALLRLPKSAASITAGTYIKDGTAYDVTGLGTLWAVVSTSSTTTYCPLTAVGDYLQAIVPADNDGAYTLTGFKAVMKVAESGEEATQNSTLTLSLPFKVGDATTSSTGIALTPNTRYPLTLTIAPHTSSVSLSNE